jgi:hypothetical protein
MSYRIECPCGATFAGDDDTIPAASADYRAHVCQHNPADPNAAPDPVTWRGAVALAVVFTVFVVAAACVVGWWR